MTFRRCRDASPGHHPDPRGRRRARAPAAALRPAGARAACRSTWSTCPPARRGGWRAPPTCSAPTRWSAPRRRRRTRPSTTPCCPTACWIPVSTAAGRCRWRASCASAPATCTRRGRPFAHVTRNPAIRAELERRLALYGYDDLVRGGAVLDLGFEAIADDAAWNAALAAAAPELEAAGATAVDQRLLGRRRGARPARCRSSTRPRWRCGCWRSRRDGHRRARSRARAPPGWRLRWPPPRAAPR